MDENKIEIKKEHIKQAKALTEELLKLMTVTADVETTEDKDNEAIIININSENETGLLIGSRGETLLAIQSAIGLMLKNEAGGWIRVVVNVGDWREKQEDYLIHLAEQSVKRAIETSEPQMLYNLTPAQRRIIHMHLADSKEVLTESEGEGESRYLVIKPAK